MTALHSPSARRTARGYILIETVVAMAVLSVSMVAIQRGARQTLYIRGQARDYTQARFLLENLIAEADLQPKHVEGMQSGRFGGDFDRFSWTVAISRVDLPMPPIPPDVPEEEIKELTCEYLTCVRATVAWMRAGREFEETAETLLAPERLFVPKEEDGLPPWAI